MRQRKLISRTVGKIHHIPFLSQGVRFNTGSRAERFLKKHMTLHVLSSSLSCTLFYLSHDYEEVRTSLSSCK